MKRKSVPVGTTKAAPALIKIDVGCGKRKQEGHVGLDRIKFDGVDHVLDAGRARWPFKDGSVSEAYSSHFLEHLNAEGRAHFANELYRVLVPEGKCKLIVPNWSSGRAYGDPTHQWPPLSAFWFHYLSREWRLQEAPHTDSTNDKRWFNCDFHAQWVVGVNPSLEGRSSGFMETAMGHYIEVVWDIHATLTRR
jgi:hypothetical protein